MFWKSRKKEILEHGNTNKSKSRHKVSIIGKNLIVRTRLSEVRSYEPVLCGNTLSNVHASLRSALESSVTTAGEPDLWVLFSLVECGQCNLISVDLPLNFHPAAIRVSAEVTPVGAV